MSYAYLALYTGDYLRDTRHLSPLKHGIYLLLLMYCWDTRGPLPLDEQDIAGIANCRSADELESLRYVLARFFVQCDVGFYNERMAKEVERAEHLSSVWQKAGKRGAEARNQLVKAKAKPRLSQGQASATTHTLTPPQTLTPPPTPEEPPVVCLLLNDGSKYPIYTDTLASLDRLYPGVEPVLTLKTIEGWNLANPTKRKTKSGIMRHIHAWFAREQNRG